MATITSPRPSISRTPSSSSHHTAPSTALRSPTLSTHTPTSTAPRRNRAALRDYYGLNSAAAPPVDPTSGAQAGDAEKQSELDKAGFDAEGYVRTLVASESLEGMLRVEGGLVNEIRALDGERKALVYDNYSKLIAATDTIRNMRTKMDPLALTTSTLAPALAHILELSASLSEKLLEERAEGKRDGDGEGFGEEVEKGKEKERQTVRWVLEAPRRLRKMVDEGKREDALNEWTEIAPLLERWSSVKGSGELKAQCERILKATEADAQNHTAIHGP